MSTRVLRRRHVPLRTFLTTAPTAQHFVPSASLETLEEPDEAQKLQLPPSPNFYTSKPDYHDAVFSLQDAIRASQRALRTQHLLPLPQFAHRALPSPEPAWQSKEEMGANLDGHLSAGMYKQLMTLLKELELYHRIATVAGVGELQRVLGELIEGFESLKGIEARKRRLLKQAKLGKKADLDEYGRSYTVGRRKTSAARVWMIEVNQSKSANNGTATESASVLLSPRSVTTPPPSTTSIMVNSTPLSQYFPLPADRERILRPLKLAGLLGAYNVFGLVRGGGTSGQSGALALAIAMGCVAHVPEVEPILKKAKLLRRDPRMVERKKPGLAKARKAYTWVKR
ncbi:ribosomal protein S9/S16-domain-containing protein [Melanogaster broomeanus]|nr:ribosomal protein S9/S16-domain-containing protein [Melanogaster broomeanus]